MPVKDYKVERKKDFEKIKERLAGLSNFSNQNSIAVLGDSLDILKLIPNQSVSLILTDPPYHSTKKSNIFSDKSFETDKHFLDWIQKYSNEWRRIIRPNGSIYVFCSSKMSARIELLLSDNWNLLSHIVWSKPNEPGFDGWKGKAKKEALRQWYPHSERILFAEPAVEGNLKRSSFGQFLRNKRDDCGLTMHQLTAMIGAHGKVNHGGAVSNWESGRNIPSKEQYDKICMALKKKKESYKMPFYEDVIRRFEVNSSIEFTDVWSFFSVRPYNGKHPAEKPIDLLEHCINASTYEEDIVLDCFAGSGTTAIAAMNLGRKTISIEIENKWIKTIILRLKNYKSNSPIHKNHFKKLIQVNEPTLW